LTLIPKVLLLVTGDDGTEEALSLDVDSRDWRSESDSEVTRLASSIIRLLRLGLSLFKLVPLRLLRWKLDDLRFFHMPFGSFGSGEVGGGLIDMSDR